MLQKTKQETAKRGRLKEAWHIVCKARTFCVTSDSCMMYCLNSQTCLSNSRPIQSHFWKHTSFQSAQSESWHHSKTLQGRNQTRLCKHRPWDVMDQLPRSQMQGSHQSTQSNSSKIGLTTMKKRLSFEGELLCDLSVLDSNTWPSRPGIRPGELQVTRLCRRFSPSEEQAVMRDFLEHPDREPESLKPLIRCMHADHPMQHCWMWKGFQTSLSLFEPRKYVKTRLGSHRSATQAKRI